MLLYTVNWADKAVYGLVAQPLAEELGLSASRIGFIGSAFFVTLTLGNLIAGLLNKWTALKWSLAILAVGWSIAMLPVVASATFTVLLVSRMLLGFLEGPSGPIIHTALYSWHPSEKRGLPWMVSCPRRRLSVSVTEPPADAMSRRSRRAGPTRA
ncbi:MFS transporter [Streptomyces antnestii]|uniref:MFS transporter n=2 Tax=Streptomyces antnestii TaxID=2494256 RepID=A0A3S2W0M1_9ACTN|nr:MFS transporter [Streptomyces sp. San01]